MHSNLCNSQENSWQNGNVKKMKIKYLNNDDFELQSKITRCKSIEKYVEKFYYNRLSTSTTTIADIEKALLHELQKSLNKLEDYYLFEQLKSTRTLVCS